MTRHKLPDTPTRPVPKEEIREAIWRAKLTQTAVAKWLGISQSAIAHWLSKPRVSVRHAEAIFVAIRAIGEGVKKPTPEILETLQWQRYANSGVEESASDKEARQLRGNVADLKHELDGLRSQIARMETALQFYARYDNYMIPAKESLMMREGAVYHRPILDDGGRTARVALGEAGEARR